jgi:hypothetical protein
LYSDNVGKNFASKPCAVNIKNGANSSQNAKLDSKILSCMYFNARSIMNKLDEVELAIRDENLDIVMITETWLLDSILTSEINIDGYTVFRKDRNDVNKTRGGGVIVYVKNEYNVLEREDLYEQLFPESIFCLLIFNGVKTLLGVCYRPPDSLKVNDEALYSLISRVSRENVIIVGDFNFAELKWDVVDNLPDGHPFITCLQDNFLEQLVDEPTRGANFLDLILCSDINLVKNVMVGKPFVTSDHQSIRFNLLVTKDINQLNHVILNYFKADYDQIKEHFSIELNTLETDDSSADNAWECLKSKLWELRDEFVPKSKRNKNQCKWVTKNVTRCRKAKKKAWNNYIKSGRNLLLYEVYKSKLRESVTCNRKAKEAFEVKLVNNIKQDTKSFYAYIRSKQRCKEKVGPLKDTANTIVIDDKITADLLNRYFASVFTTEDLITIPDPYSIFDGDINVDGLTNIEITEELVLKKLTELNINKSQGVDDLHPKLLFELRNKLVKPLTELFNLSLKTGKLPQDWKDANVTPLFKKGARDKPENYRPISLTSIICKLLESIIKDHIVEHLDKFKLLHDSQHGFRKGRSCLTNLLDFMEEVTKVLENGDPIDIVYLDFAKAFDKVPYVRLFRKLESHGIGGQVLTWIKQWLCNRRQRVSVNKKLSDWLGVSSGVPQGSVLGPVLFLIYINDIDLNLISKLGKFADDTKLCKPITCDMDREMLQSDLDKLHVWSNQWQMTFNVDKCSIVHLGFNNEHCRYKLGDSELKSSERERDLGVIVDSSGKWEEQCNVAVKNANSTLGIIKRHFKCRRKDVILKLYKSLVRPKLEYCVQAWCPYLKKNIDNIERVQHRATKLIHECRELNYEGRLAYTGLITLEKRRERGDLIQVFKLIKGLDNVDYKKFFQLVQNSKTRGHSYKLVKFRSKLNVRNKFFSQRIINSWNSLPEDVVQADSVNCFKNRLDKFWG